jgi:hypothetical protein
MANFGKNQGPLSVNSGHQSVQKKQPNWFRRRII